MRENLYEVAIEELKAQRNAKAAQLDRLDRLIEELEAHRPGQQKPRHPEPRLPIPIFPGEFKDLSYAESAKVLIERAARPLTTRELLDSLQKAHKPVQGRDPYRLLYRSLLKHRAFVSVDGEWHVREYGSDERSETEGTPMEA